MKIQIEIIYHENNKMISQPPFYRTLYILDSGYACVCVLVCIGVSVRVIEVKWARHHFQTFVLYVIRKFTNVT